MYYRFVLEVFFHVNHLFQSYHGQMSSYRYPQGLSDSADIVLIHHVVYQSALYTLFCRTEQHHLVSCRIQCFCRQIGVSATSWVIFPRWMSGRHNRSVGIAHLCGNVISTPILGPTLNTAYLRQSCQHLFEEDGAESRPPTPAYREG